MFGGLNEITVDLYTTTAMFTKEEVLEMKHKNKQINEARGNVL